MGRIVVGVDGSDCSRQALAWALDEARLRQSRPRGRVRLRTTSGWLGMGEVVGAAIAENFTEDDVAAPPVRCSTTRSTGRPAARPTSNWSCEPCPCTPVRHWWRPPTEPSLLVVGTHGHGDLATPCWARSALTASTTPPARWWSSAKTRRPEPRGEAPTVPVAPATPRDLAAARRHLGPRPRRGDLADRGSPSRASLRPSPISIGRGSVPSSSPTTPASRWAKSSTASIGPGCRPTPRTW